jgi:hypothetical protein
MEIVPMASVRFAGAVLNKAEGAGTVTETLTLDPLESTIETEPLPLFAAVADMVNVDPLKDTPIRDGVSELAV